jgi:hypothetical protein
LVTQEKPELTSCQPFDDEPENEITLTAFRLLTMDLLVLFHVMNEGTINLLGRRTFQCPDCFALLCSALLCFASCDG